VNSPASVHRRPITRVLGSAVLAGIAGGLAAGLGLGVAVAAKNDWAFGSDAVLLCAYLVGLYALVYSVGLGVAALALVAVGIRPRTRFLAALLIGASVFLSGVLRYNPAIQLFAVVRSMNAIGFVDLLAVGLVSLGIMGAILSASRARALLLLAASLALLAGLQALHSWHERPRVRDLAAEVPPLLASGDSAAAAPRREPFRNARMVVLGLDGLGWEVLIPLLRRGELPHFRRLLRESAWGYLESLPFAVSPPIWETIATGQRPFRHGIGYHAHFTFPGVSDRVRHLPVFRLGESPLALRRLLVALRHVAPWDVVAASSHDARVARFWEIVSRAGLSVGNYGFGVAAPAAPLLGFLHGGYGFVEPMDYPPDLQKAFPELPDPPLPRPGMAWLAQAEAHERALAGRFVSLALQYQPEVLLYYTHFADAINHLNWKDESVGEGLFYGGLSHPDLDPGPTITAANRFLDDVLGDVLARLPEGAILAVVSDHGFEFRGYEHDNSPPGAVILHGRGLRPGPFAGASVFDVAPTLLHLLGLPIADDMEGAPVAAVAVGGPLDRPIQRIASYGPALSNTPIQSLDRARQDQQLRALRALGYVVD
jgi:hypothetical protein